MNLETGPIFSLEKLDLIEKANLFIVVQVIDYMNYEFPGKMTATNMRVTLPWREQ